MERADCSPDLRNNRHVPARLFAGRDSRRRTVPKVMHCQRRSCISARRKDGHVERSNWTFTHRRHAGCCRSGCIRLPAGDASDSKPGTAARKTASVVVWDGDEHGGSAKEWANCNLKGACQSSVKVVPAAGTKGSNGLEWHTTGKDWKGFGWNWFGFWPEDAGTDITKYHEPDVLGPRQARTIRRALPTSRTSRWGSAARTRSTSSPRPCR